MVESKEKDMERNKPKGKRKKGFASELAEVTAINVSYVDKGANLRKFIVVKNAEQEPTIESKVRIVSKNEEERTILGVVYEPWKKDAHDDFMRPEEIRKMAHKFFEHYRAIDKQHNFIPGAGVVLECWTAPVDMQIEDEFITKGTWLMLTRAEDEEAWQLIKSKEYTGYSLWGIAKKITEYEEDEYNELLQENGVTVAKKADLNNNVKKDFNQELANDENNNLFRVMNILENAIWRSVEKQWFEGLTTEEMKEEILQSIDQFREKIASMSFEVSKSNNNNEVSKQNTEENSMNLEEIKKSIAEQVSKGFDDLVKDIKEGHNKSDALLEVIKKMQEQSNSFVSKEDFTKSISEIKEHMKSLLDENFKKLNEEIEIIKRSSLDPGSSAQDENGDDKQKTKKGSLGMLGIESK